MKRGDRRAAGSDSPARSQREVSRTAGMDADAETAPGAPKLLDVTVCSGQLGSAPRGSCRSTTG